MISDTFIKRPILASVCSLVIILGGVDRHSDAAGGAVSRSSRRRQVRSAVLHRRGRGVVETAVTTPIEQAINGVEGMTYMSSTSGNDGTCSITVTFDVNRDIDIAAVDVQNRISQVQGRLPNEVKRSASRCTKASSNFVLAAGVLRRERPVRLAVHQQLHRPVHQGRPEARAGRRRRHHLRRAQVRHARCGWTRSGWRRGNHASTMSCGAARAERPGGGGPGRGAAGARRPDLPDQRARGRPARASRPSSTTSSSSGRRTARSCGSATSAAPSLAPRTTRPASATTAGTPWASACCSWPDANTLDVYRNVMAELDRLSARFPPGLKSSWPSTRRRSSRSRSTRSS